MPRVSREQADSNRLAIQEASARLFREQGLRGVSVADVMAAAGLTHGGFYGHFASKDELAAVACATAFEQSGERWRQRVEGKADAAAATAALVDGYLTRHNRDATGSGCPVVGLAGDVAREPAGKPVREAYLSGVKQRLEILLSLQDSGDEGADREAALAQMCTMVGAMVLARATRGDAISGEFLEAAKAHLARTGQPD